jgi:hypothetical protein
MKSLWQGNTAFDKSVSFDILTSNMHMDTNFRILLDNIKRLFGTCAGSKLRIV